MEKTFKNLNFTKIFKELFIISLGCAIPVPPPSANLFGTLKCIIAKE